MDKLYKKCGFTLLEILIVLAILGIIAAIILPLYENSTTQKTKESAAKENLRILRNAIELYTAQHNGAPPGYPGGNKSGTPNSPTFMLQLCSATNSDGASAPIGTEGYPLGPYLSAIPKNPFNDSDVVKIYTNSTAISSTATGTSGWLYKPLTKTIKLNYAGTDSQNIKYFDY